MKRKLLSGSRFDHFQSIFYGLTGLRAESFSFPGREKRDAVGNLSILVTIAKQEKYIMTFRGNLKLAHLESEVLQKLCDENAPVPKLINGSGHWLVQEYLGETRLSQALNSEDEIAVNKLLESALGSLIRIQKIALDIGLNKIVSPICNSTEWRLGRMSFPERLGELIEVPSPTLDKEKLSETLGVNPNSFIKWDARPGNAIIQGDNSAHWFDWEHCGRRAGIDDLLWLLTDEWVACDEATECSIIENSISLFDPKELAAPVESYLFIHGTLHMCGKLLKILESKGNHDWLNRDECLKYEQMGVTFEETTKLFQKACRWSAQNKLTKPLSSWLHSIQKCIEDR